MNITDIRVKVISKSEGKLRAVASIVFDNAFVVHDIKVIEGNSENFIVMPSRKGPDGEYHDVAHPLRSDVREEIKELVLKAYEVALKEE